MNGLTAADVSQLSNALLKSIEKLFEQHEDVAAKELQGMLNVIEIMQRQNATTHTSRPDRVGDECWYAASNDPYKRGVLRAWLGGQYEGHAVAVEDVETNAIRYVDYISFSAEAPK